MSTKFYRPSEVAELLGISTATLRRWARQYRAWLSSDAGGDQPGAGAGGHHRRYAREDVQILAHIKAWLQAGHTHAEIQDRLGERSDWSDLAEEAPLTPLPDEPAAAILPRPSASSALAQGGNAHWLQQSLDNLADSQQLLLSSQHAMRQMMGVLLQDNFNLKDENTRLRERIVESERKLYELKRELDLSKEQERERVRQLEAYLFELQRRLDSMTQGTVVRQSPAEPAPLPESPAAEQPPPPSLGPESESPAGETPTAKRGFWQRLFGRHAR